MVCAAEVVAVVACVAEVGGEALTDGAVTNGVALGITLGAAFGGVADVFGVADAVGCGDELVRGDDCGMGDCAGVGVCVVVADGVCGAGVGGRWQ